MTKQIVGHPDYYVTDAGEVLSCKRDKQIVLVPDYSNGYPRVTIDGDRHYLADLVARYFLAPPRDSNYKVFYIDGDKTNCSVRNLRWMSQSDIKRYSQYSTEYRREVLGEWA